MPALKIVNEFIEVREINKPIFELKFYYPWLKSLIRLIKNIQMFKKQNFIKRSFIAIIIGLFLLVQNPAVYVLAFEIPDAPSAPTPPPEPESTTTVPEAPSAPDAPDAPDAPTLEEMLEASPTPTPEDEESISQDEPESGSIDGSGESQQPTSERSGEVADGQVGDVEIDTGDATNTAVLTTTGNNNYSTFVPSGGTGSVFVGNSDNASDSTNTGSINLSDSNNTFQDNSTNVGNNLTGTTTTGDNSASNNVGNSSIETGDANTSGTIITAVNTNVDGVAVAEFNVVDDHIGDVILDFSQGCISGCSTGDLGVVNSGNGEDSTNTGNINVNGSENTFQENDATIENSMLLASDSGSNNTDRNTGGDSSITTGDVNVTASILSFANNNIVGGVIYAVVNIYGNLIGDIILPEGSLTSCCGNDASLSNTGNATDSTNTASLTQNSETDINQFNNADIENNLIITATTGDNSVSANTGGDNNITTGDTDVLAQVVNIANNNLVGGNYWLVIVNEAGRWIGKILGFDGSNIAGSSEFEIAYDENGEIFVTNSGNGSGSTNTGNINQTNTNTIVQSNEAKIVNNVNLLANTGGNSASDNVGGNSSITTGDANVIANIVNFVNNNIVGSGKLFVTVVNVFGSWMGNFVGPGFAKENENENLGLGGAEAENQNNSGGNNGDSANSQQNAGSTNTFISQKANNVLGIFAPSAFETTFETTDEGTNVLAMAGSDDSGGTPTAGKKVVHINLAYLIPLIPVAILLLLKRRRKFAQSVSPTVTA